MKKEKVLVIKIGEDQVNDLQKLKNPKNVAKFPDNVVYFKSYGQLASVFSEKKVELLDRLAELTGQTVTKLALDLGRKKEAISRDLHELDSLGFIEMIKDGNRVYPKLQYQAIQISLRKKKN